MDINMESTRCPPSSKLSHCPRTTLTSLDVSFLHGCLPEWSSSSSSSSSSAFLFLFFSVLPANSRDHILRHLPKQRAKLNTGLTILSTSAKHSFGRILTASTKQTHKFLTRESLAITINCFREASCSKPRSPEEFHSLVRIGLSHAILRLITLTMETETTDS